MAMRTRFIVSTTASQKFKHLELLVSISFYGLGVDGVFVKLQYRCVSSPNSIDSYNNIQTKKIHKQINESNPEPPCIFGSHIHYL